VEDETKDHKGWQMPSFAASFAPGDHKADCPGEHHPTLYLIEATTR
jgi:hypothetical protein